LSPSCPTRVAHQLVIAQLVCRPDDRTPFQQGGAPADTKKLVKDWIATNRSEFIGKDEWSPKSPLSRR